MQVKIEVNAEVMQKFLDKAMCEPSLRGEDLYKLRDTFRVAVIKESARRSNRALMLGVKI